MKTSVCVLLLVLSLLGSVVTMLAQEPSPTPVPAPSIAPGTDSATATRAWLDTVPPDKKARSDAYFEGGYWLILWNFLLDAVIAILLLSTRLSARMRDFAERMTRFKSLQVALYAIAYVLITSVLSFPLIVYQRFFREHAYGLATQTFGAWFSELLIALAVSGLGLTVLLILLYAVFRRAPRTWWIWATAVVIVFLAFVIMIAPIYIEPLFNKYKPLENKEVSDSILAMARANQIPVTQVFEVDASRQSNRVSANVAGFLGTTRIALNDNLLKQCTLPEIRSVMAHEMGHYILNHITKFLITSSLVILISFALAKWAFEVLLRRWGSRWGLRVSPPPDISTDTLTPQGPRPTYGIADPATLPLLALIFAAIGFLLTPVNNTITRVAEVEADAFGVNTAREPDGFAKVALKLGTYRKLDPTPLEEFIFFDHPSGRARIRMAMDWKAAHLPPGTSQ